MLGYEKPTPTSFTNDSGLRPTSFVSFLPPSAVGSHDLNSGTSEARGEVLGVQEGSTCHLKPHIQNAPNTRSDVVTKCGVKRVEPLRGSERFLDSLSRIPEGNPTTNVGGSAPALRAFTEHTRTHPGTNETTEQAFLFPCLLNHVLPVVSFYNIHDANREMEEKLKIVNYLKQHPSCLKSMKISKKMTQEMMGDLLTNTKLTLVSLHGAAAYYHLHVMIVNTQKMTYIDIEPEDAESTLILSVHGAQMFCVQRTWTEELVKTQYLKQDSHERVLRSLSSYHRQELLTMAQKCRIVHDPKDKKEELSNKILKGTYGSL